MKIITINIPVPYLKMIDKYVGDTKLYPSRSELVRVALREFLIQELQAESFTLCKKSPRVMKEDPSEEQSPSEEPLQLEGNPQWVKKVIDGKEHYMKYSIEGQKW